MPDPQLSSQCPWQRVTGAGPGDDRTSIVRVKTTAHAGEEHGASTCIDLQRRLGPQSGPPLRIGRGGVGGRSVKAKSIGTKAKLEMGATAEGETLTREG